MYQYGKYFFLISKAVLRNSFLHSFARRSNLGDITAKANSQEVVASLVGMGIGIVVATLVGGSLTGIAVTFAAASAAVGFSSYRSLGLLALPTLNWQRARLLIDTFVRTGKAASPAKVNAAERYISLAWPWAIREGEGSEGRATPASSSSRAPGSASTSPPVGAGHLPSRMSLHYGAQLHRTAETGAELRELQRIFAGERYILSFRYAGRRGPGGGATLPAPLSSPSVAPLSPPWPVGARGGSIAISMAEGHDAQDALRALLQASRLERLLVTGVAPVSPRAALEATLRYAQAELPVLRSKCEELGWDATNVLFVPQVVANWRMGDLCRPRRITAG